MAARIDKKGGRNMEEMCQTKPLHRMYDSKEIEKIVKQKKKTLLIKLSIVSALMITSLILSLVNISITVTFVCIVAELVLLFAVYKIFDAQLPSVCFSKEIRGVNIREDEYVSRKAPGLGMRWHQVGTPASRAPVIPKTGANKRRTPPNIRSRVYLQLEDGDVVIISPLCKSHTELFIVGDTLLKYAGTQYPVIINRKVNRQPCPICGEINDMSADSCHTCGLSIIKSDNGD